MGPRYPVFLPSILLLIAAVPPAFAGEADALAISQNIQDRHFPHYTVLDPVFDAPESNRIVSYTRAGDSAIWTGYYLAAESFRYSVTHSQEALDNARRAVAGIQSLVDVTGNNVLARCLIPDDSPYAAAIQSEEAGNGIYHSGPGNFWVGNTSRDQYSGVLYGLGVAYDLIDDAAVKKRIASLVTRLVQFLKDHGWRVVLPNGTTTTTFSIRPDQQLAFLQLARHVNPGQFSTAYDIQRLFYSTLVMAPIGVDVLTDSAYFKFNLDAINLYTLIRLESSSFGSVYRKAYDIFRNHVDDHGNPFFNMIDHAVNGPNATRDAETLRLLDEWLERPRRDLYVDNRGRYSSCADPEMACSPLPVMDRVTTDFLWQRSPFQLASPGGQNTIEGAGIDYILPYWMARYYRLIDGDAVAVQSASGAGCVVPGSIASAYGLALPSGTDGGSGVTVSLRDGSGNWLDAVAVSVTPGEVDFLLSPDTAPGTASVVIRVPGGAAVVTSVEVLAVQ